MTRGNVIVKGLGLVWERHTLSADNWQLIGQSERSTGIEDYGLEIGNNIMNIINSFITIITKNIAIVEQIFSNIIVSMEYLFT